MSVGAPTAPPASPPLLQVSDLMVRFSGSRGTVTAVDRLSFSVGAGETLGLVGESGSGKTISSLAIQRLLPQPPAEVTASSIRLSGEELMTLSEEEMRKVRGRRIGMVFQEPMAAINPVMRVGDLVAEALRVHLGMGHREASDKAVDLLRQVGIPDPRERAREYPHQLSGGMKQRVMIAAALACDPELIIADEPTTALDVTIQAQILSLFDALQRARPTALLLVTHDLGVVAQTCDRVVVLYAGKVMEQAGVESLFRHPAHPYTVGLFGSLPHRTDLRRRLVPIPGSVPPPGQAPPGCPFRTRCSLAVTRCEDPPLLREVSGGHFVACHRGEEVLNGVLGT